MEKSIKISLWNNLTNFLRKEGNYAHLNGKPMSYNKLLNYDESMHVIESNPDLYNDFEKAAKNPDKYPNWVADYIAASSNKADINFAIKTKLKMSKSKSKKTVNIDDVIDVLWFYASNPAAYNLVYSIVNPDGKPNEDPYERVAKSPMEEVKLTREIEKMVKNMSSSQLDDLIDELAQIDQEQFDQLGPEEYAIELQAAGLNVRDILGLSPRSEARYLH